MQPGRPDLSALVDRWVAAGIITPDQADRIRADLATHPPARPVSLVAEGLGYLGGVIVVVGLLLVLGLSWENLSAAGKVAVVGVGWLALTAGGAFVPARRLGAAGTRLRAVLWTGAAVAIAAGLGLIGSDLLDWKDEDLILLVASGGAAVMSAAAWAATRHVLPQTFTVAALLISAWSGTMLLTNSTLSASFAMWGVGIVWFLLALVGVLPRNSGAVLGAVAATVGGLFLIATEQWGSLFALGTVLTLVAVGVVRRQLAVLGVGSVGTLIALPIAVDEYFPGVLPAAISLVVGGMALVVVAIFTARRRRDAAPAGTATTPPPDSAPTA